MPYRGIQLTPKPTSEQPGDIFPIDLPSGTVVQIRGSSVLQTWSVSFPGVLLGDVPPIPEPSDVFRWLVYWEAPAMAAQSVAMTNVERNDTTGTITVSWSDGENPVGITIKNVSKVGRVLYVTVGDDVHELPGNPAELRQFVRQRLRHLDDLTLICIAIAQRLQTDATLSDPSPIVGRQMAVNFDAKDIDNNG